MKKQKKTDKTHDHAMAFSAICMKAYDLFPDEINWDGKPFKETVLTLIGMLDELADYRAHTTAKIQGSLLAHLLDTERRVGLLRPDWPSEINTEKDK